MQMRVTRISKMEDIMRANIHRVIKTSTTMINTMTKVPPLLVSNHHMEIMGLSDQNQMKDKAQTNH